MSEIPEIGKISPQIFNELIYPHLGAKDKSILVGPQHGVDSGIVEIGGKAVAVKSDPVFIVPEYGWERAAWFAINIIASDITTSGLRPRYMCIDLNLPMSMTKDQLETMWKEMHRECARQDIAIVTGHTARYENCHYPMVGGATMIGVGELDEYVNPGFARAGDKIIITKGPAIEACGIFATMFPAILEKEFGSDFSRKAQQLFYKMSVVDDALTAIKAGIRDNGVTSMHDATECGIWGALYEVAQAADLGVRVDKDKIVVEDGIREICSYFKIDPYASISEGTLIITCRPHKADKVVDILADSGIKSSIAGELTDSARGMILIENKKERKLEHPIVDPFWRAFYDAQAGK